MRPIDRFKIGETIAMPDGSTHTIQAKYVPYKTAKPYLCANFGNACVYCEASYPYERELHVEHILPKDKKLGYSHLQYDWENFLLSCATCNGTDNKGSKVLLPSDCHFPHLNNTFLSLKYDDGGVVKVNPALEGKSRANAEALLKLVGLDKSPAESNPGDTRWKKRLTEWNMAKKYLAYYNAGTLNIDILMDYITARGCWSIYFTVFDGIDEVREKMITSFPGTAKDCFDPANHFAPIPRNPGLEDPV